MSEESALISGSTIIYAMIGHPIAQVKSPLYFNRYFRLTQTDAVMAAIDIEPDGAEAFFAFLRHWRNCPGCVVTVPHKQAALRGVDTASERAKRIGAVNIIRRSPAGGLDGDMVDGLGYLQALAKNSVSIKGKNMLLIGAGGVGSAIAHAVAEAGLGRIYVIDNNSGRRETLLASLRKHYPQLSVRDEKPGAADLDIIANATPLGMLAGDPQPYPLANVRRGTVVTDVITAPVMTPWLETAREKGCIIQTGPEMTKPQMPIFAGYLGLTLDENTMAKIL